MAEGRPRPRPKLGQHFLIDQDVIARIVDRLNPSAADALVEIGPGRGALTEAVLELTGKLTAIELDVELAARLASRFGDRFALKLIRGDALRTDWSRLADRPLRVFGNLPYTITSDLLIGLIRRRQYIADMLFMLQKEVVDRLAADPGTKAYGRLTVMVASYFEIEPLFEVPPQAFRPPPSVTSRLVALSPRTAASYLPAPDCQTDADSAFAPDLAALERITRAAFQARRKTLRNALRPLLSESTIASAGVDPGRRPDSLGVAEFGRLSRLLGREAAVDQARGPWPLSSARPP